jgi:hypothetical protein
VAAVATLLPQTPLAQAALALALAAPAARTQVLALAQRASLAGAKGAKRPAADAAALTPPAKKQKAAAGAAKKPGPPAGDPPNGAVGSPMRTMSKYDCYWPATGTLLR